MRPESAKANEVLNIPYRVLDNGFVALIDYMGADSTVATDARRSYQGGTTKKSTDERLTRRLYEDRHTSPFEMVELKFYVSAPIVVVRELFRHRTASVNELSGRYSEIPAEFYIPAQFRTQSTVNRQGSGEELNRVESALLQQRYLTASQASYSLYTDALDRGVAREHARICLPVNIYTNFVWKIDLHNFLHFCGLRRDMAAMQEIREYAHVMFSLAETVAPTACGAFMDNHPAMYGGKFNREEMELLRRLVGGAAQSSLTEEETYSKLLSSVLAKLNPKQIESRPLSSLVALTKLGDY